MRSFSPPRPVERARPLLGTMVSVRACFADTATAHTAIDAVFAEIALVHRLMSFHEPGSDVSRLNREAAVRPVAVDGRTFEVLRLAQALACASKGCFDVTVGGRAVRAGALPRPPYATPPDPDASWLDVELIEPLGAVAFRRPLWIDLGGIAKGYAVDRAIERLRAAGARQASVNAGGDLRVMGTDPELVHLRCGTAHPAALPVLEVADGAVASSGSGLDPEVAPALHFDGASKVQVPDGRFVTVVAPTCMVADALTKVVMAQGEEARPLLARYCAGAHLFDHTSGWRSLAA